MDWIIYWFMFPVCVLIASIAMFSGISGAAMLFPVIVIGFPLFGVPPLTTVEAVGVSMFLETSGFGTGVYGYVRKGLVDLVTVRKLVAATVPLAVLGALVARQAPEQLLRLGYGVGMLALAALLWSGGNDEQEQAPRADADTPDPDLSSPGGDGSTQTRTETRQITAATGKTYRYEPTGLGLQRVFSASGAFVAGMISTGVGEATLPGLVRRSAFPVAVAAATSTVVVAATVLAASVAHGALLAREGGFGAIPWNLLVWAVPGAVLGALLGTRLQGRVDESLARRLFGALFAAIGVTFLLASALFASRLQ